MAAAESGGKMSESMRKTTRCALRGAIAVAVLAVAVGCGTARKAVKTGSVAAETSTAEAHVEKVAGNFQTARYVTAKASVDLRTGKKNFSLNGSLRMKRDDVIQLSLTFFGMEVARMEFTPEYVMIIDRFNKQYVKAAYKDAGFLRSASLDFYVLQSMFWNEIFVPGQRDVRAAAGGFAMSSGGSHTLLSLSSSPKLNYDFLTQTESGLLDRITVTPKDASAAESLICQYGAFGELDGKRFPATISLEARGGKLDIGLAISLSRIANSSKWETRTQVPESYRQRPVEEIMKKLSVLK